MNPETKIYEFKRRGMTLVPFNENSYKLISSMNSVDSYIFVPKQSRDYKFHACFFSLLGFIYDHLPEKFTKRVSKNRFYIFLKELSGEYEVEYEFSDGTQMKKYTSISFGKMSQEKFYEYVRKQVDTIVSELLIPLGMDDFVDVLYSEYQTFISIVDSKTN